MTALRALLRAELLIAIGFFAGAGFGGLFGGMAAVFAVRPTIWFGYLPWLGPVLFWGGQVALLLLFAKIMRGRAVGLA